MYLTKIQLRVSLHNYICVIMYNVITQIKFVWGDILQIISSRFFSADYEYDRKNSVSRKIFENIFN